MFKSAEGPTTIPTTTLRPPGPGAWSFDRSHQTTPWPRLGVPQIERGYVEGFRAGFREVGALLETIELRVVDGWAYTAPRPVGAPADASGPPPKLVFKALLLLHPGLRSRVKRSERVFVERPWRDANARWERDLAPSLRAKLEALSVATSDDEKALAGLVRRSLALIEEAFAAHMDLAARTVPAIGDYLVALDEWAGVGAREALRALGGWSQETVRPRVRLRAIAAALRDAGLSLPDDPDAALALMRAHATVAKALDVYLVEYGWRVDGLAEEALAEHPSVIVAGVRAALDGADERVDVASDVDDVVARLRARVPAAHHAELEARLSEAREAGRFREESAAFVAWAAGQARRNALELGTRWAARGRVDARESALDLEADEIDAVVAGGGPTRAEIAARTDARRRSAATVPPATLGKPAQPPPIEWLPRGAARLTRAVMAFVSRFEPNADVHEASPLTGLGVAPGVVEATACVVRSPSDLARVEQGCVVVAPSTNVGFNAVLSAVAGVVTEHGGLVSHAAIVSRELGIPGVVGCKEAMSRIPDGARIRVDGDRGVVEVIDAAPRRGARSRIEVGAARSPRKPIAPGGHASLADAHDAIRFGGKAAGLARAMAHGLPVPRGIALDVDFVEGAAAEDVEHLARIAALIDGFAQPLAVRSSAVGEDGADASFAGIHHTSLGVRGPGVAAALTAVWRSAWADAALAYRRRRGIGGEPRIAAVVQEIVPADVAGVLFGRDPLNGSATRVVEASWGLGAVVVDGRVTPDRFRVDDGGKVIERVCGRKPVMDVVDASGAREMPVPTDRVERTCLEPNVLDEVLALGRACDALAGRAQDVEWAWASGKVWLLQMRPITGVEVRS